MSDVDQSLKVLVQIAAQGQESTVAAVEEVKAATEQLTVGQANLASALPDLTAKTNAYVISSKDEHIAITEAEAALSKKIAVLQASGKDTSELEKAQTNLNNALSTQQALLMGERIRLDEVAKVNKAAAAAALEKAAADKAAAMAAAEASVANEAQAATSHVSALAVAEMAAAGREIGRGNYSRLAGTLSRLAQGFDLLRFALSPIGVALLGVGAATYFVYEHFKELNEELDKLAVQAADPTFLEGIRAKNEALMKAADAAQEYAAKLSNVVDGENGIITVLNQELALQEAITAARGQADSAQNSAATAKTQADEARGTITPEMAIQQEADEKKKAATDETAKKQAAQDQEMATKQAALAALTAQLPGGQAHAAAIVKAHTDAAADREQNAKEGGTQTDKRVKELSDAIEKNTKGQEVLRKIQADLGMIWNPDVPDFVKKENQQDINNLSLDPHFLQMKADQNELTGLRTARSRYAQDQTTEPEFNAQGIAAKQAQKIADAEDKLTKEIKALTDKIAETRPDENTATAAKVDQANSEEVAAAAKTNFGKDLDSEKGDAYKILTGQAGQVGAASQNLIEGLGTMIAGHTVTMQEAARLVAKADANNENFRQAFEAFNKTADEMKNFSQATVARLAAISKSLESAAQNIDKKGQ